MRSSDVTFKKADVPIETRGSDEDIRTMDIIEIKYPDGKVVGFPADMKSPETGVRYRDMYPAKYKAFKNGEPDPDRVDQLQREIAERQAELDGMGYKAPDDERLTDNLGYGSQEPTNEHLYRQHDEIAPSPVGRAPSVEPGRIDQPELLGNDTPLQDDHPSNLDAPSQAPAKADDKAKEPA